MQLQDGTVILLHKAIKRVITWLTVRTMASCTTSVPVITEVL